MNANAAQPVLGTLGFAALGVLLFGLARSYAASGDEFWDAEFGVPGVEGYGIAALAVSGNQLFAGGSFLSVGGVRATNLACWNGRGWFEVGGGVGVGLGQGVRALVVLRRELYAAGYFTNAGAVTVNNVARWDGTNWLPLGSGINNGVAALATDGRYVYAGGDFTEAGGIGVTNVARWDGERWWPLGDGVRGEGLGRGLVEAIAVGPAGVYVAGDITSAGGVQVNNLARWDGTNWFAVGEGIPRRVRALAVSGDEVYAGGDYYRQGDLAVYVNRWDGARWQAILTGHWPGAGGAVALLVCDEVLYVGGGLVFPAGFPLPGVARWDGRRWWPLGSGLKDGAVHALASTGAELFVGGGFTSVGGKPATNIGLWHIPHALGIARQIDQVRLSWPATGSNLVLEASPKLPATAWVGVSEPPSIVEDQLVVTNRTAEPGRFYRLRRNP